MGLIARTADQVSVRAGFFRVTCREVMDFLFGYGPLQPYILNEAVTDVDATAPDAFTIKVDGVRQALPLRFSDAGTYDTFCRLLVIRNGGQINENDSHCRVTDEQNRLRINVTIPPRSVRFPTLCIRKHRKKSPSPSGSQMGLFGEPSRTVMRWAAEGRSVLFCAGALRQDQLAAGLPWKKCRVWSVVVAESDSELSRKALLPAQRIKNRTRRPSGQPVRPGSRRADHVAGHVLHRRNRR